MDNIEFYILYITITALLFAPSLWAKFALGGKNHTGKKQLIVCLYNVAVVIGHLTFADTGHLHFVGETRSPVVVNVAGYMIFAYIYAMPRPYRYTVEEKRAMLKPGEPDIEIYTRWENLFYYLRVVLFVPAFCVFYTCLVMLGVCQFITLEPHIFDIILLTIYLPMVTAVIIGALYEGKKYGRIF
ncbi:hypothetical protein [Pseudomonas viridiflava]|uniref:hypothetical protein n=1 Tax=Pseudomonas viridiflava TaxID=33069 RepID=UPI000F0592A2|nr:hypothetical protein [Pseudomonas viridiflava]